MLRLSIGRSPIKESVLTFYSTRLSCIGIGVLLFIVMLLSSNGALLAQEDSGQKEKRGLRKGRAAKKAKLLEANPQDGEDKGERDENDTEIHIIHSDRLVVNRLEDDSKQRLIGDVEIEQGNMRLLCDSARFYQRKNNVEAFGNIVIEQGDSVTIKADKLYYDGNSREATLYGNVYLTDKESEIEADTLIYDLITKRAILVPDVRMKDGTSRVRSDSLTYFVNTKTAYLNGNVEMTDDEVFAQSDSLRYNVNTTDAELYGNVQFKDDANELEADQMSYNVNDQKGNYRGNGRLKNEDTTITSERGDYFGDTKTVTFEENVHLVSPQYDMKTDQLVYNTETELANMNGPTEIVTEDGTIVIQSGSYDLKNDRLITDKRATVNEGGNTLTADNLNYDKNTGEGFASGKVVWYDEERDLTIYSEELRLFEEDERVIAYEEVLLTKELDGDTLYLIADTLTTFAQAAERDSITGALVEKEGLYAYHNVRIYKSDMQGICDSLVYDLTDSTFQMYQDPILWVEQHQLEADTLLLYTENNSPSKIEMRHNAFLGTAVTPTVFDQVKGRYVFGDFLRNKISSLLVEGNAESIYYAQENDGSYSGMNRSISGRIKVVFSEGQVDNIRFLDQPIATFYPIDQIPPQQATIKGFRWKTEERPQLSQFIRPIQ